MIDSLLIDRLYHRHKCDNHGWMDKHAHEMVTRRETMNSYQECLHVLRHIFVTVGGVVKFR